MNNKWFKNIAVLILLSYISSTHAMTFMQNTESSDQPHCQQMNMLQTHSKVDDQADNEINQSIEKCLKHCAGIVTLITASMDTSMPLLNNEHPLSEPVTFTSYQSDIIKQPPKHC